MLYMESSCQTSQRIAEIIKRKNKQRLAKAAALARKEAAGDFSHLKNKKGELIAQPLPQPTLPNVKLDDDDDASSVRTRGIAPSTFGGHSEYYYSDRKEYGAGYAPDDYPPMPAYDQGYGQHGDRYNQFNPSVGTLPDEQAYDDNDYGSTANLALSAAPIAYPERGNMISPRPQYGYTQQQDLYAHSADPHAAYRGQSPGPRAAYNADSNTMYGRQSPGPNAAYGADSHAPYRGQSPGPNVAYGYAHGSDLAYDGQYQQQHHTQQGYGYPAQHGGNGGYDYGAGQAHAM
jgi:hypothetical protein